MLTSLAYVKKHKIRFSIVVTVLVLLLVVLFWPITVYKTEYSSTIPVRMEDSSNPFISVAASAISTNATGNVAFTVQNFNYTSSDGTTKVSATSASISITMNPQSANVTKLSLNIQLSGLNIVSPSFTGKIGSATLSGYVLVNPATNQLVVSLVGSTNVASVLQGVLGY